MYLASLSLHNSYPLQTKTRKHELAVSSSLLPPLSSFMWREQLVFSLTTEMKSLDLWTLTLTIKFPADSLHEETLTLCHLHTDSKWNQTHFIYRGGSVSIRTPFCNRMTTRVTSRDHQEIVSKLTSDKAKTRDVTQTFIVHEIAWKLILFQLKL